MKKNCTIGVNSKKNISAKNELAFIPKHIQSTNVYAPPLFEKNICRLYMNENLFGPSPKCIEALNNLKSDDFYKYAYGGDLELREALSKSLALNSSMISLNHGAAESLTQVFRTVMQKDDIALIPNPGWSYYKSIIEVIGGHWEEYSLTSNHDTYSFNIQEILKIANQYSPKILIITTPNMPTGNIISSLELEILLNALKDTLIIVDEAYLGFSKEYSINYKNIINKYNNVVFIRTFSKLYGLASQRIGYIVSNENLISEFAKLAPLFGIPYTSQLIAKAALQDVTYYNKISNSIIESRDYIKRHLDALGNYKVYKSHSNFVLVEVFNRDITHIINYFKENGYLIRNCSGYKLNSHLRLSIGTSDITKKVVDLFIQYEIEQNKYSINRKNI